MKQRYVDDLATKIDIEKIKKSGIKILYDAMYGAGQGGPQHDPSGRGPDARGL